MSAIQRQLTETGLLQQASVELDKHLSMHPALRANRVTGGKSCPLSSTGEVKFTGCGCLSKSVMPATPGPMNLHRVRSSAFNVNDSRSRASDSRPHQSQYRTCGQLQNCRVILAELRRGEFRVIDSGMTSSGPDERLVFVDLETGGLETWRPIIQIAAISVTSSLREIESFEAKLRFESRFVDPKSLCKNNYSVERWSREAHPARNVATAFADFLRRHATVEVSAAGRGGYQVAQLVAHNAAFDGPFLQAWFQRMGLFFPGHFRLLCTVQRAVWLFHEDKSLTPPRDFKLGTLCEYFGVPLRPEEAHDALNDVRATVSLYRAMHTFQTQRRIAA